MRDCGSVNGTMLNGVKLVESSLLHPGDRITLGDSEVVFHSDETTSQFIAVDTDSHATNLAISVDDDEKERSNEKTQILSTLALEFLADRPMSELFDFILDRVIFLLRPTRAAIALLGDDRVSFANVKLRRLDATESNDLTISRTLLRDVVDGRKVVSYFETNSNQNDKFARAQSIIAQSIRSAVCAPLLVADAVLGVLYIDYTSARGVVAEDDVRLLAQIARFAAVTLERTRLREEAFAKAKIDEELRTAYKIQRRLLPDALPEIEGYRFAGANRPCKTVSGDYYDVVVRPDGRIYFVIADVSGKGHGLRHLHPNRSNAGRAPARDERHAGAEDGAVKVCDHGGGRARSGHRHRRFRQRRPRLAAGGVEERGRGDELDRHRRRHPPGRAVSQPDPHARPRRLAGALH